MHLIGTLRSLALMLAATPLYAQDAITVQDTVKGAYEIVHSAELGQVFVAASPAFGDGTAGYIHVLDDTDLRPIRQIQLARRAFGLALDHTTDRLYVGHTMDGALGVIDAKDGLLIDTIQLGQPDAEGKPEHTRMIALDEARGRAFITSPTGEGIVWIVDTKTNHLLHRIDNAGLWAAGAAYDPDAGRFYSSGGGIEEISVFDADSGDRIAGISTGDTTQPDKASSAHFFVNLAIDIEGQRLFAADASTASVYGFDIASGEVLARIPIGAGTLDVAFNKERREIYATYRGATREEPNGSGGLMIINADDYSVKHMLPLTPHPNSLEVAEGGKLLYVTVKSPYEKTHPDYIDGAMDKVVRIDLEALQAR